jgi:hypothetical protein
MNSATDYKALILGNRAFNYEGQSNENGSPRITLMAPKLVTLECAYGTNIWWGLGKAQ